MAFTESSSMKEGANAKVEAQSRRNWWIWIALVVGTAALGAAVGVFHRQSESVEATALLLFAEPDGVRSDKYSVTHYTDCVGDTIYCSAEIEGDDIANAEVCAIKDSEACAYYCTEDDDICNTLCGTWCANGAGALCGLTILSNLPEVCREAGYCKQDGSLQQAASYVVDPLMEKITGISIGSADGTTGGELCDYHAYCDYCLDSDDCRNITCSAATSMRELTSLKTHCRDYVSEC